MAWRGWTLAVFAHDKEGLLLLMRGLTTLRATGTVLTTPTVLMLLADAHAELEQPLEGLKRLDEAEEIIEET